MVPNPMFGANPFKLGIFNANCNGGLTLSTVPERWQAAWDDVAALALMAEGAGLEFILPVAKWKGYGGEADNLGYSYETLTHGAALAAMTSKISIFSTVNVQIVHPVFAAKALATIDHVSHGRAGLNIVCGWNQEEFDLFGIKVDPATRYRQGLEWYEILLRLLEGGAPFDHDGEFYRLRNLRTSPVSVQRPRPITMSAGFSPAGRDFAARTADFLFTNVTEISQAPGLVGDVAAHAARYGRSTGVFTMSHVVCRETRKEAEGYFRHFAQEKADPAALAFYKAQKGVNATAAPDYVERPLRNRFTTGEEDFPGAYPGAYPLVGTPEEIVAEMAEMHRLGLSGTSLSFVNYLDELPFFIDRVLPLMEQAGLRLPAARD